MTKKLKIHALLWGIVYIIFLVRQLIDNEIISKGTYIFAIYYLLIVLFVFVLNLIHNRLVKWLIIFFLFVLPISLFIYNDNPNNDFTLIYVIMVGTPADIPILPDNTWQYITHSEYSIRVFYQYLVFFILPIFYWVGLYYLSKYLVARYFTKSKDKSI